MYLKIHPLIGFLSCFFQLLVFFAIAIYAGVCIRRSRKLNLYWRTPTALFPRLILVWALLRVAFFSAGTVVGGPDWEPSLGLTLLFLLPVALQFAVCALLAARFTSIARGGTGFFATRLQGAAVIMGSVLMTVIAAVTSMVSTSHGPDPLHISHFAHLGSLLAAFTFSVCALMLLATGMRLLVLVSHGRLPPLGYASSKNLVFVLVVATGSALSRAVWNILTYTAVIPNIPVFPSDAGQLAGVWGLFFVWEFLPSVAVLFFFGTLVHRAHTQYSTLASVPGASPYSSTFDAYHSLAAPDLEGEHCEEPSSLNSSHDPIPMPVGSVTSSGSSINHSHNSIPPGGSFATPYHNERFSSPMVYSKVYGSSGEYLGGARGSLTSGAGSFGDESRITASDMRNPRKSFTYYPPSHSDSNSGEEVLPTTTTPGRKSAWARGRQGQSPAVSGSPGLGNAPSPLSHKMGTPHH